MNKSIEMAMKRERRNRSFILKAVHVHTPDKPSENAPVIEEKPDESVREEPEITVQYDEPIQDETPKEKKRRRRASKNKANEDSEVSEG